MKIRCPACQRMVLARVEPIYEGFSRVGEVHICTACGGRYSPDKEEPPSATASGDREEPGARRLSRLFAGLEPDPVPAVFSDHERRQSCTWCRHFIVNPFDQRCGLTNRHVEATDCCENFDRKEEPDAS